MTSTQHEADTPVAARVAGALAASAGPTWLELVRGDQTDKFANLMADLRLKYSPTGDGKRITCGYAYMGLEPALAWENACRDLLYPVMRQSIESFAGRWHSIRTSLENGPYHYVSLGPGDGQKDGVILTDLRRDVDSWYVPVDSSTEMLRLAVRQLIVRQELPSTSVLALPWDFSANDDVVELRKVLTSAFGPTPVLFSLLGNTLANFDHDTGLLALLAEKLLRPQDRLLLEVATTPDLTEDLARHAAAEYESSGSFGDFVTSALRRYTDLCVDKDSVDFTGSVEDDHALLVKMNYRNQTGADITITLPSRDRVPFKTNDTIRLAVSRKYAASGLDKMIVASGLTNVGDWRSEFTGTGHGFGLALRMLARNPDEATSASTLADQLWNR